MFECRKTSCPDWDHTEETNCKWGEDYFEKCSVAWKKEKQPPGSAFTMVHGYDHW